MSQISQIFSAKFKLKINLYYATIWLHYNNEFSTKLELTYNVITVPSFKL